MSIETGDSGLEWVGDWKVPLSCPNCSGVLSLVGYVQPLKVLKARYWHTCSHCGFVRTVDDFKKDLLTV